MIQSLFVVNKSRNTLSPGAFGIEPLSARSLVLSVLLGSHPPSLSGRQLTGLAELFEIRPGTVRTALSRMVRSGDLVTENGNYGLGPRMLDRQREQDEGRTESVSTWDGRWFAAIAAVDRRSVAERRSFRSSMTGARMAELRPDIWMRPGNIAPPQRRPDIIFTCGELEVDDEQALIRQLWPLDELTAQADELRSALEQHRHTLDDDDPTVLPPLFVLSAAVVRFLRVEPQLPTMLMPEGWTPPDLRPVYDDFEVAFQHLLRSFLQALS